MPYKDPEKQKAAQRAWYERNRATVIESSLLQRDRNRLWFEDQRNQPCVDCGGSYPPCCMDFHHRDPSQKKFAIGRGITQVGRKALEKEIAKCDLLCANCHRIRHSRFYDLERDKV